MNRKGISVAISVFVIIVLGILAFLNPYDELNTPEVAKDNQAILTPAVPPDLGMKNVDTSGSPEGGATSSEEQCNETVYEFIPGEATTSPSGRYRIFRDYHVGGFCISDTVNNIGKIYKLGIPKGWEYDHFSEDGSSLFYRAGFYELPGDLTPEEENEVELEAKKNGYGLHLLNLETGKDVLVTPWSWE